MAIFYKTFYRYKMKLIILYCVGRPFVITAFDQYFKPNFIGLSFSRRVYALCTYFLTISFVFYRRTVDLLLYFESWGTFYTIYKKSIMFHPLILFVFSFVLFFFICFPPERTHTWHQILNFLLVYNFLFKKDDVQYRNKARS